MTSGSLVGNLDVAVFPQFDIRDHLELGREAQRLASWKWTSLMSGVPTTFRFSASNCLCEVLGDQAFQHALPDIAGKLLANRRGRRLTRPEAGELGAFLDVRHDAAGFAFHLGNGNGNFQRPPTTFCYSQVDLTSGKKLMVKSHDTTYNGIDLIRGLSLLAVLALLILWASLVRRA